MESNWPLIIPPLLTLIDDDTTEYKSKGCELLTLLLNAAHPDFLQQTGLGEVFEDAVMPCLSYLPTLTLEIESLQLLGAAYPALVTLAHVRYPKDGEDRKQRTRFLGRVLHQGVLKGYVHAGDHAKIAELLVLQISVLVDEMGVSCVKHFKARMPYRNFWVVSLTVVVRTCSPCCRVSYRRLSPRPVLLYFEHLCSQCSKLF